jgi:hypothetical protein
MVEAAGIEPASEVASTKDPTRVAECFFLASARANRRARAKTSSCISPPPRSKTNGQPVYMAVASPPTGEGRATVAT